MDFISLILHNVKLVLWIIIISAIVSFLSYFGYIINQNAKLKNEVENILTINRFQQNISANFSSNVKNAQNDANKILVKTKYAKQNIVTSKDIKIEEKITCEFNNFSNFDYVC